MNILFTICGRAGSKGFKNKNLKLFLDKPLVYYSISAIALYIKNFAQQEQLIDVVLNTDSEDLIDLVKKQQMLSVFIIKRKAELGGDSIPKVTVIKDCLNQMESDRRIKYDIVVDLDITSPLRTAEDIDRVIHRKWSHKEADAVYTIVESRRNPYFNMVKREGEFFCKAISSEYTMRQQAPDFYDMNASIYAYSVEALRKKKENVFFNDRCDAIVMQDTGILDIDSEEDFELMQVIAKYLLKKKRHMKQIYDFIK